MVKIIANAYWAPPYVKDVDTAGYTGDLYITNYRLALFVPTFAFSTVRRPPPPLSWRCCFCEGCVA